MTSFDGYQLLDPHRPTTTIAPIDEQEIRAAVRGATRVAVQATGHGRSTGLDGGLLIDTRRMNAVRVDAGSRTAWVQAGATWQDVIAAAGPHGLAPLSGSHPGVGAVSYTLGGGVGLMARRYGFAADHVRRIDLVTTDGTLHRVTADAEPDLFWALRGGGGNFGVVTGIEIDLMPVARIFGGSLHVDVERVPDVLEHWRRWTTTVPEETTSAVAMLPYPQMVPPPLGGRHVAQIQIVHVGSAAEGERLVEPLRALGPHLRDTLRELPYTGSGDVFDEPDEPHPYRGSHLLLRELDPAALTELTKRAGPGAPAMCVVGLRHLGGALARPPRIPNAVGHRDAAYSVGVLSPVEPGAEETVRATHRAVLEPFDAIGRSLNFGFGPLDEDGVRSAYAPQDLERLVALRAHHDPRGVLHANHPLPALRRSLSAGRVDVRPRCRWRRRGRSARTPPVRSPRAARRRCRSTARP